MSKKPFNPAKVALSEQAPLKCPYCNSGLSPIGRDGLFVFIYKCDNMACRVANVRILSKRQCPKCELPKSLCMCDMESIKA